MRMTTLSRLLLLLGVAAITYGLARWQIVTEILSKQSYHLDAYCRSQSEQFFAAHGTDPVPPTNWAIPPELSRLRRGLLLSGGSKPGWPQAIIPCAVGLMLVATSYYFGQKNKGETWIGSRVGGSR
jgi:hypothetical protein